MGKASINIREKALASWLWFDLAQAGWGYKAIKLSHG
jgi:hypothetical protein